MLKRVFVDINIHAVIQKSTVPKWYSSPVFHFLRFAFVFTSDTPSGTTVLLGHMVYYTTAEVNQLWQARNVKLKVSKFLSPPFCSHITPHAPPLLFSLLFRNCPPLTHQFCSFSLPCHLVNIVSLTLCLSRCPMTDFSKKTKQLYL